METITFFDANCQVGRYNYRIEGAPYALDDLAADMQAQGIARRLVYHAMAKENSPAVGNRQLGVELAGHDALVPCWAVSTWVSGEMPAPADLIAALREQDVRAVRFFREYYHVPMAEWSMGALWSELEVHRVPLFLDLGFRWATMDDFDAEEVYRLCHAHPNLPVILVKHRIRYNRQVYQLFEACPNLRLELSGYWHFRAVEEICRRFGEHRLLFGTNWPYMDSSFAVAMVMYAEVSSASKAAVAGGNLDELLGGVRW
jgi:predicted TIM-barrel fold metal-dependent hydrolase